MVTRIEKPLLEDQLFDIRFQLRLELARKCAAEGDILGWGKAVFPEKFELPFCFKLHNHFVAIRDEPFTNTEAPRNHSKTTIKCFLIPIFQALEEPKKFRHYLNVQATDRKALAVNTAIKLELQTNPYIIALYGNQVGERWTDQQFVTTKGVVFTCVGAGQSIRGINYRNVRPDYIIVDDLYNEEHINNPDATIKLNEWFWGSLYPARAKTRRCSVHVQGTAINNEDILAQLAKQPGVRSETFKAIEDWDNQVVLWPELNTFESLQRDRTLMGTIIFMREMQNERRDDATSIIKRAYLQNWEYDPSELRLRLERERGQFFIVAVELGNDPSIGKDSESDANAVAVMIKTGRSDGTGNEWWIEELHNGRLSLEKRIGLLVEIEKRLTGERRITKVKIEAIAGFDDYAQTVISRTNLPVDRISWVKDKISTLESKSHYFENGKIHLNKQIEAKLKDMLLYQLTTNHPKHDDLRDAVLLPLDDQSALWSWVK